MFSSSGSSVGKESACSAGDPGLTPGQGRFPEEGNGNPLQYSCLGNPWTEEAGGPQFMKLQKGQTELSNQTTRGGDSKEMWPTSP